MVLIGKDRTSPDHLCRLGADENSALVQRARLSYTGLCKHLHLSKHKMVYYKQGVVRGWARHILAIGYFLVLPIQI